MAANQQEATVVASGADVGDGLRRRPVTGAEPSVPRVAEPDEKKLAPKKGKSFLQILNEWECVIAPIILTALAIFTRLWKIGISNIVTWDEAQYVTAISSSLLHCRDNSLTLHG
jgi:dolichyl-phosphate-mannose-protein mannosyltransferase